MGRGAADETLFKLIDDTVEMVERTANPKSIYRIFDCTVTENALIIDTVEFKSKRLAENLKGCKRVAVLAATMGTECDRLLRANAREGARLAVIHAVLNTKIEDICDELQRSIEKENGVKTRSRYSPGYFDLDISEQKKLFSILEITKRCGITLTDTFHMIPTKSVTAFAGIDYEN